MEVASLINLPNQHGDRLIFHSQATVPDSLNHMRCIRRRNDAVRTGIALWISDRLDPPPTCRMSNAGIANHTTRRLTVRELVTTSSITGPRHQLRRIH